MKLRPSSKHDFAPVWLALQEVEIEVGLELMREEQHRQLSKTLRDFGGRIRRITEAVSAEMVPIVTYE